MYKFIGLSILVFLLPKFAFTQILEDEVFVDHIQSVRLYPMGSTIESMLDAPVISLSDSKSLILLFDDLAYDPELYSAKLVHCDADWKKSGLKDNDFSLGFNEYTIQEYDYSVNTRIPYIHYSFVLPKVTKSGNYILKVYKNRNENDLILSKRFMVFETGASVGASVVPPVQTEDRGSLQQINAIINYSGIEVVDPGSQIKVMIRQNQRWDNAKFLSKPTFLNQSSKLIRYESLEGENSFRAGNEFRFIDLRFIRATGVNVASIKVDETLVSAEALLDNPRSKGAYSQYLDLNGQYVVLTNDRPGGNPEVESEYVYTTFYLKSDAGKNIKLLGALSGWGKIPESKLVFDSRTNLYTTSLLLKQGWYDYQFANELSPGVFDTEPFEGSFFQTENEYEVLVYFRGLGSRYDQLVGYVYLHPNRRRL